ncbi:uncharacterized protein LOC117114404 [Anneissia japonica]|uniref:uncharacterized protein LOC117114404 n=1 Tax=Anneissia japonica TaxID=1529436 RepID=UPI001425975B|nr:uncharacterized protein LOC117114404 [Anneissia japonica]
MVYTQMGLSKFKDQPTFNWADSIDDTLVKEVNGTKNSSTTTTSVESPSNIDTGNDAQKEQNDPTNVTKTTLDTQTETQQTLKPKSAAGSADNPPDAAKSLTNSTESDQTEALVKNKSAEDAATIQTTDGPKQDIEPQVLSGTAGVSANNAQPTQYVQYSTADGEVCWGVAANQNWSASSVPVITTNQHMVIDVYNLGERLCALETQWGQWIPYLNSKIDHLTNCHQLLFDDCNVQKANISDLSERIHYQQSNGGGHQRGSWASRQHDRRYDGYRNRNTERERRYNEESKEVVGYYEYYKNQFNRPFGRGRGNYRRDRRDNEFYRKQDDTRYGYYYRNRQYETAETQERGQRWDDENHSEEDEKTEKEESRFDCETRQRRDARQADAHAQHTQEGSDQHNDLEEERVVIIPQKS